MAGHILKFPINESSHKSGASDLQQPTFHYALGYESSTPQTWHGPIHLQYRMVLSLALWNIPAIVRCGLPYFQPLPDAMVLVADTFSPDTLVNWGVLWNQLSEYQLNFIDRTNGSAVIIIVGSQYNTVVSHPLFRLQRIKDRTQGSEELLKLQALVLALDVLVNTEKNVSHVHIFTNYCIIV